MISNHMSNGQSYRMCLFGGEIGWMENFREKMGRKTFLECVWLGKENKWWGPSVFSSGPPKSFLRKMEKKLKGENEAA